MKRVVCIFISSMVNTHGMQHTKVIYGCSDREVVFPVSVYVLIENKPCYCFLYPVVMEQAHISLLLLNDTGQVYIKSVSYIIFICFLVVHISIYQLLLNKN